MLQTESTVADPAPSRRFGRTALVVLAMTVVTAGAFGGVAFGLNVDAQTQDALAGLMYTVAIVGVVWSIVLSVRALKHGEPIFWPGTVLLILLWGASVPLLMTWTKSSRGRYDDLYFLHVLCLPALIPFLTFAFTLSFPLYLWKRRTALRSAESEQPFLLKRARRWLIVSALLLLIVVGPFVFYAYGGTMYKKEVWTVGVVEKMPRWMGNLIYRCWMLLPASAQGSRSRALVEYGLISAEFHRALIDDAKNKPDRFIIKMFSKNHPDEAMAYARERIAQDDFSNPIFESDLAFTFFQSASHAEIIEMCRVERFQKMPMEFLNGLLSRIYRSEEGHQFLDYARAWYASGVEPAYSRGAQMLVLYGSDEEVLRVFEKSVDVNGLGSCFNLMQCLPKSREGFWEMFLSSANGKLMAHAHTQVLYNYQLKNALSRNRNLPARLAPVLAQSEPIISTSTALMILYIKDEITSELRDRYIRKANRVKVVNVESIEAASEAERAEIIEKARAVLKKW